MFVHPTTTNKRKTAVKREKRRSILPQNHKTPEQLEKLTTGKANWIETDWYCKKANTVSVCVCAAVFVETPSDATWQRWISRMSSKWQKESCISRNWRHSLSLVSEREKRVPQKSSHWAEKGSRQGVDMWAPLSSDVHALTLTLWRQLQLGSSESATATAVVSSAPKCALWPTKQQHLNGVRD